MQDEAWRGLWFYSMDSEPLCAGSAIHGLASHLDQRDLDDCDKDQFARR
jgi:hypothetical protein